MNREIKFRAFDTENKEMLEVQELDYEDSWNGQPMVRTTMYNDYFDTEEMILMQYTGLKDKNGVEIYENMIINNKYIVIYDFCKFALKNIKNGNITDFKKDGVYEITREYFEQ